MHSLFPDFRYSLRLMGKHTGKTLLVIATLGLGIGFTTAIVSVVNAVVLRPLPIFEPDRIVWVHSKINGLGSIHSTSYPDYLDWKSQNRSFEDLAALYPLTFTHTGDGLAENLKATGISACGFKAWGIGTILGRDFTEADDRPGAERVTILTYAFWQHKFGGNRNVLDKTLVLDDQPYRVIGVLQPNPITVLNYPDIYVANGPLINPHLMERDTYYFYAIGRLKPNVTETQAQAEMDTIARRLEAEYGDTNKNMGVWIEGMSEQLIARSRKPLLLLTIAASLIFLLATVNVASVFLAGAVERRQELSIRLALGVTRLGLLRQLFIEALVFAALGGTCGLLLAKLGVAFFVHHFPATLPRFQETTVDWKAIAVTAAMTFCVTLVAAIGPATFASRTNISTELKGELSSPALYRYPMVRRTALVFFEVSLASALALISGLLIKSFYEVKKVDLGFNPSSVFAFEITPPAAHYKELPRLSGLYSLAIHKLSSLPGMQSASGTSVLPVVGRTWINKLEPDSESPLFGQEVTAQDDSILPGFFKAMNIPLLEGREFTDGDRDDATPVIIVDDALAAKLWPGKDPLGRHVRMSLQRGLPVRSLEVVGVAREIKSSGPERKVRWMQVYVPQYEDPSPTLAFVVNTTLPGTSVKAAAEKAVFEIDKDMPVENFQALNDVLEDSVRSRKAGLILLGCLAVTGLMLGLVGIFGVVANAVVHRRREIAIRMALGATRRDAVVLIIKAVLVAVFAGLLAGGLIVVSFTRLLSSFLFGISAVHLPVYLMSAVTIVVLALTATIMPAARLFSLDIQKTLRE